MTCIYLATKIVDRQPFRDLLRQICSRLQGSEFSKGEVRSRSVGGPDGWARVAGWLAGHLVWPLVAAGSLFWLAGPSQLFKEYSALP